MRPFRFRRQERNLIYPAWNEFILGRNRRAEQSNTGAFRACLKMVYLADVRKECSDTLRNAPVFVIRLWLLYLIESERTGRYVYFPVFGSDFPAEGMQFFG